MKYNKLTPEKMWAKQQINYLDVDYPLWNKQREFIRQFSRISQSSFLQ